MLRRYPYWGWLVFSIVLWVVNGLHFYAHRQEMLPEEMAHAVNADVHMRIGAFNKFTGNTALIQRLFTGRLSEQEVTAVQELPFYVYAYDGDSLKFWSTNSVVAAPADSLPQVHTAIRNNPKGVFLRRYFYLPDQRKKLVALFPLLITYPLENDYLHTHFAASANIPVKTRITTTGQAGAFPVVVAGEQVAWLTFNAADIQKWEPDALLILTLLMASLATVTWLQLIIIHISRKKPFAGLFAVAVLVAVIRVLLSVYGIPFHLDTLTFFSPMLYASSIYLSSLGDLFTDIFLVLWLVVYVARHTPYRQLCKGVRQPFVKVLLFVLIATLLTGYTFFFIRIIRSLVIDSSISFDVTHFYAINVYTFFGLLAVIIITAISAMVFYLLNVQLAVLVPVRWQKTVALLLTAAAFIAFSGHQYDVYSWLAVACLTVFLLLTDIPSFKLGSNVFRPYMIVWGLLFCLFCTGIVRYYNEVKEQNVRRAFVDQHLTPYRDLEIEYNFDKVAKKIEHDTALKSFFYDPTANTRKILDQHFETHYLTGHINKYQAEVYIFDKNGNRLFNKDTSSYEDILWEKQESSATNSPYLFYKESILDRHFYLSYIPVYSDTINNVIGYVMIDLDLKKSSSQTVYPELLQPVSFKSSAGDNEYAYAVYLNGKLITQANDYAFPVHMDDSLQEGQFAYVDRNGIKELYYKIGEKRTVIVVHHHSEVIEALTLFSYIFGIELIMVVIIFLYQVYLSYFTFNYFKRLFTRFPLRRRVHTSLLSIVFLSFVILGTVTIKFFISEYRTSATSKLHAAMQVAKQSVQDYLEEGAAFNSDYLFDSVCRSAAFKTFVSDMAGKQKIDINIYDDRGSLFASSQEEIYDKGVISRYMKTQAFYELDRLGKSRVVLNETAGNLKYIAAYQPLRDEHGVTLGYISVPFFSSEKDLDFQISNIIVTLINLYAFIFLVSSIITVAVTRWITSTFDIIIRQFDKLNLVRNERLEWPYDDEIGRLVAEYNKMVKKVEDNALRLAQSERETAWREMARQVAHEIKNPLTPMKLNIQYLQQAMRADNPNIKQLTLRLSESIIEQIDNLSYIASEFSNFAKMPEARPEEIDLTELLDRSTELYNNNHELTLRVNNHAAGRLMIMSDRSQLLRVFANLFENAKQAIPADRHGSIDVTLSCDGQYILIAISDNGIGISEEVSRRIFQPYFTTKSSGTGLGLAMTKKIIEFWKGEIWFETVENEGTTFYIRLPMLQETTA